ncbi:YebC-like protein, partial [Polychaeton citri CBS 116435]
QFRLLSTTHPQQSGHNRWSKIRHDKSKADNIKNKARNHFASEIATASRLFGPNPGMNPRLADLITKAKREGFAKASIEGAIARGQGRSVEGKELEIVNVEGMLKGGVAVVVESETDNKARTVMEVRNVFKAFGGREGQVNFLFTRVGKVVFEVPGETGVDDVLEPALDAGAVDVVPDESVDEGKARVVVVTQPGDTKSVAEAVEKAVSSVRVVTAEISWVANQDTKVPVESKEAALELEKFIDMLAEKESTIQGVAMNVNQGNLDEDIWKSLQGKVTS